MRNAQSDGWSVTFEKCSETALKSAGISLRSRCVKSSVKASGGMKSRRGGFELDCVRIATMVRVSMPGAAVAIDAKKRCRAKSTLLNADDATEFGFGNVRRKPARSRTAV